MVKKLNSLQVSEWAWQKRRKWCFWGKEGKGLICKCTLCFCPIHSLLFCKPVFQIVLSVFLSSLLVVSLNYRLFQIRSSSNQDPNTWRNDCSVNWPSFASGESKKNPQCSMSQICPSFVRIVESPSSTYLGE